MAEPITPAPHPVEPPQPGVPTLNLLEPHEAANDLWAIRAAVALLGVFTLAALGCATWLEAVGESPEVLWALLGAGVGALATLATTRLGGSRPQ